MLSFFRHLEGNLRSEDVRIDGRMLRSFREHQRIPFISTYSSQSYSRGRFVCVFIGWTTCNSRSTTTEKGRVQQPVYYVSYSLRDAETRYPNLEKLTYSFVVTSRKLRQYFQGIVLTDQPLRRILDKPNLSKRLVAWAIELGQFYIDYRLWTTIKAQALTDFVTGYSFDEPMEIDSTL